MNLLLVGSSMRRMKTSIWDIWEYDQDSQICEGLRARRARTHGSVERSEGRRVRTLGHVEHPNGEQYLVHWWRGFVDR
jgi:hypothetical protein